MIRFLVVLFFVGIFIPKLEAQTYYDDYVPTDIVMEAGGSFGTMHCLTDLGGNEGVGKRFIKDLNLRQTRFNSGFYFGALYKNKFGLRLEATFGSVSASDDELSDVPVNDIARTRYNRGLNFRSNITEFSLLAEAHPLFIFVDWENREMDPPSFSPYLTAGIGYFSFNPQAELDGNFIDLQPLSTEGQGLKEFPDRQPYKLRQFNFPFGAGIRYDISPLIHVKGEFLYRKLNTDYLDDVSTTYIDGQSLYELNGFSGNRLINAINLNNRSRIKEVDLNEATGTWKAGSKRGSQLNNDSYFTFNIKIGIYLKRRMY